LGPALVETAVELCRGGGPDAVVLREVARRTGVSHNAAYRHFSDREALLAAVADQARDRLEDAMRDRIRSVHGGTAADRTWGRLRAIGRAYVEFALAEPGLFDMAFSDARLHPPEPSELGESGPYVLLGKALDDLVTAGLVTPSRREGAEILCWAAVHGFALLHLHGPLRDLPAEVRARSLELTLTRVQRGLS
jgi:AcrR family transcriptional regulator